MEKKYLYAYMETRAYAEFAKIARLDETIVDHQVKTIITYPDGASRDVTRQLCMHGWFTEAEAERTIASYRKTGYWPGEMPPEQETECKQ